MLSMIQHESVDLPPQTANYCLPALASPPASAQHNNRYGSLQLSMHQRAGSGTSSESLYESVREQTSPDEDVDAAASVTPTPQPATTPSAFHARRQALRCLERFLPASTTPALNCWDEHVDAAPCRQEEIARELLEAYTNECGSTHGEQHASTSSHNH